MVRLAQSALSALVILAACGGSGAGAGSGRTLDEGLGGILMLVDHSPAADAVQVPVDSSLQLTFDAPLALDGLYDADTWLHDASTGLAVAGSWHLAGSGNVAVFTPTSALAVETDYVLQISPLTCDVFSRILEVQYQFTFRTTDTTPPTVLDANVVAGQSGVDRTAPFTIDCSEAIDPASAQHSLSLKDVYGISYPGTVTTNGHSVTMQPLADLPGDRTFVLAVLRTLADRAGNRYGGNWAVSFHTAVDTVPPTVTGAWPANASTSVSPAVEPRFTFSESMDPLTVEPSSLLFQDQYGSAVAFSVLASDDQRTLRIHPHAALLTGRTYYTLAFLLGAAAATDVSGNPLASTGAIAFSIGTDATPPTLVDAVPNDGEPGVSPNAIPRLRCSEALAPAWLDHNVELRLAGTPVSAVVDLVDGDTTVQVAPVEPLTAGGQYVVHLRGGDAGLRDLAGNPLAADVDVTFTVSNDVTLPSAMIAPEDGSTAVPYGAHVAVVFADPFDPSTVDGTTVQVLDPFGAPVDGTLAIGGGNRTITFAPALHWISGIYYHTVVRGGRDGVRAASGNWLGNDLTATFRAGSTTDHMAPALSVTLNQTDSSRLPDMVVPPSGFSLDVGMVDPIDLSLDMASVQVTFSGPGSAPSAEAIYAAADVGINEFHYRVPASAPLAHGDWTVTVSVADLSGNTGVSASLPFHVDQPTDAQLPFERTQIVWLRTDLDRNGNGRADFLDDLVRLGLAADGDPAGTNGRMQQLVLDSVLARAYALIGRGPRGEMLSTDAVRLRYTLRQPIAVAPMQIALGGFDPDGDRTRSYGADSTGVLGRALYDRCNSHVNENNTSVSPGLGVFPGEMFLYQARIHQQVYPSFVTLFAQRFLPLCPDMGGVPVGTHALDAAVLADGFDYATATSQQRARYSTIMAAIDDWSHVIGVILAHEVGHTTGLVAPGPSPTGLFGDSTLHDGNSTAAEVMAAAVGYEAMVTLPYHFRDIDLSYLRQRTLLR